MSCILKSTSDVKAIRESYEGNYIEPNVPDSVGKLDDRAEERTLEKKHEISEMCLVLESSTLSDTERYGHVSSFTHDRCCVKLSPSNMIGSNAKEKRDQKQINRCISAVCSFPPFLVLFDTILIEFQRK